jgi:hypothetical protein
MGEDARDTVLEIVAELGTQGAMCFADLLLESEMRGVSQEDARLATIELVGVGLLVVNYPYSVALPSAVALEGAA